MSAHTKRSKLAEALQRLAGQLIRLGLRFIPQTEEQACAARQLRNEISNNASASESTPEWSRNRQRLREQISGADPRAFLTWDVIAETMFLPSYAAITRKELKFLKQHDWTCWRRAIRERLIGFPFPSVFYPLSSSNAIHHAYHLCRFEHEAGLPISAFHSVLELGGGYGSLCRIVHALGFVGQYAILDLPEQSALQRYYLGLLGLGEVRTVRRPEEVQETAGKRLFIATWSLSESPLEVRKQITSSLKNFDAFLIAYQAEFAGIDNLEFFREWQQQFPSVRWKEFRIGHLPNDFYLFGKTN